MLIKKLFNKKIVDKRLLVQLINLQKDLEEKLEESEKEKRLLEIHGDTLYRIAENLINENAELKIENENYIEDYNNLVEEYNELLEGEDNE